MTSLSKTTKPMSDTITRQTSLTMALVGALILATASGAFAFAYLRADVNHLGIQLDEIKKSLVGMRDAQTTLTLVLERMRQDDAREIRDAVTMAAFDKRIRALESK